MIRLSATTKKLSFVLDGGTTGVHASASYNDAVAGDYGPGVDVEALSNGTTAVDLVPAPAASTTREIDTVTIRNTDGVTRTVTVYIDSSGTHYELVSVALPSQHTLQYTHSYGWHTTDEAGRVMTASDAVVTDGDYGDIVVSGSGTVWTIDSGVVTYAKMQDVSATSRLLGRITAGAGSVEELTAANVKTILALAQADITGLTTADSPQFAAVNIGHATDTTVTRVSAGVIAVEGATVATLSAAQSWTAAQTFLNSSGVKILDTNASNTLGLVVGSDLTADRTLTITTGDASRTITLNGNVTLSGTNTGDQTITLTSDVTGSGTGSFATTIAANAVTDAKFRQSAGLSVVGRSANTTGNTADITGTAGQVLRVSGTTLGFGAVDLTASAAVSGILGAANGGTGNGFTAFSGPATSTKTFTLPNASATVLTDNAAVTVAQGGTGAATLTAHAVLLGAGTSTLTFATIGTAGRLLTDKGAGADPAFVAMGGDATINSSGTLTIANAAVTLAKIANASANSKLLGSGASGSGASYSEITLGTGLSMTGTTLSASGGSGTVTSITAGTGLSGGTITTTGTIALDVNSLTAADPAFADNVAGYSAGAAANRKFEVDYLLGLQPAEPGGRLSGASNDPATPTSSLTGITTLYYTPFKNNRITLWDGTRWVTISFLEASLALGTMTSGIGYDVFGYLSAGVFTLEKLAWTSATARATAVTLQDGRYCKSGDKTRLYLGSFYANTTTTTSDAVSTTASQTYGRCLFNAYNRVVREVYRQETTDSWNYTTATFRAANASADNRVHFFRGLDEDAVWASVNVLCSNASNIYVSAGIGVDSTSANSAQIYGGTTSANSSVIQAIYMGRPGVGYHYLAWLEESSATGTTTWYGDAGRTDQQSGLMMWGLF